MTATHMTETHMKRVLLGCIAWYQKWVSPLLGPVCRFEPSCSRYTATCIERHGAVNGSWLGFKRICRCNPLFKGGFDLPPAICSEIHSEESLNQADLSQKVSA